jgi:hypothetical protein
MVTLMSESGNVGMIVITNDGDKIKWTNYWDHDIAKRGLVFLSFNAGAGRLLLPDDSPGIIALLEDPELSSAILIVGEDSKRKLCLQIAWLGKPSGDHPSVVLDGRLTDRRIPPQDHGRVISLSAWTRNGEIRRWPCTIVIEERIPDVKHDA